MSKSAAGEGGPGEIRAVNRRTEVWAFVHAKGTSERLPGKNLKMLGDRPLFAHAVANARRAERVDRVVVDSDSDEILDIGIRHGAVPLKRPARLATNQVTGDDLAVWQAKNAPGAKIVLQVVPTAPFLSPASIDRAVGMLRTGKWDSVVGAFSGVLYPWANGGPAYLGADGRIPNEQQMKPLVYETTGLYANRAEVVLRLGRRMNPNRCAPLYLSRVEAIDVNTPDDFAFAEIVWRGLQAAGEAGEVCERPDARRDMH